MSVGIAAILHSSSYGYGIGGGSCYHNFYYVNIALVKRWQGKQGKHRGFFVCKNLGLPCAALFVAFQQPIGVLQGIEHPQDDNLPLFFFVDQFVVPDDDSSVVWVDVVFLVLPPNR